MINAYKGAGHAKLLLQIVRLVKWSIGNMKINAYKIVQIIIITIHLSVLTNVLLEPIVKIKYVILANYNASLAKTI